MKRSHYALRAPLVLLGLLGFVACTDRLTAPQTRELTARAPGFKKDKEKDIGDGAIFTGRLTASMQLFDSTGKVTRTLTLPENTVSTRMEGGTATINLPAPGGKTTPLQIAEALHGKKHAMKHHDKATFGSDGAQWDVSADGDKSGGPMSGATLRRNGVMQYGVTYDWMRIEGGWALRHFTVTLYEAGRRTSVLNADVTGAQIASLSTAAMFLGDATGAIRHAGGAFSKLVLPALAYAQPVMYDGFWGWVEAVGVAIGVVAGVVGSSGLVAAGIAIGGVIAVGAMVVQLAEQEGWWDPFVCWVFGGPDAPYAVENCLYLWAQ